MEAATLVDYLDNYLNIREIADYGPQGLQVEAANSDVSRLALAVDTAPDIIAAAAEWDADLLLVHHGILWRSVDRIAGPLGQRVRMLLDNDMHLYAAHLSLDAHPIVGNNVVLANLLEAEITDTWCDVMGTNIGVIAGADMTRDELVGTLDRELNTTTRLISAGPERVRRLAIISGFGADKISEARELGADTFLTGETSHANFYAASDYAMNVAFAGHYATETVGVRALGKHLTDRFPIEVRFFDYPTGM